MNHLHLFATISKSRQTLTETDLVIGYLSCYQFRQVGCCVFAQHRELLGDQTARCRKSATNDAARDPE